MKTQEIILERETIKLIVKYSDKKRFQISDGGLNIRAVQEHSTDTV
ncbi:MAG: RNA 2'-phosphotransferase [Acinetobacter venetianus]